MPVFVGKDGLLHNGENLLKITLQEEYHDHLRSEHDISICRLCSAEFAKKEELKQHVDIAHRKKKDDVKT